MAPELSKDPAARLDPSDPLRQPISIEWAGEARLVVKRIAEIAGWRFAVVGSAPLQVNLKVKAIEAPLINVIEDIAVQLGNQADIRVNKGQKTIELVVRG